MMLARHVDVTLIEYFLILYSHLGKYSALVAYHSLLASEIQYGIIAWGSASNTYLEQILTLQKKGNLNY